VLALDLASEASIHAAAAEVAANVDGLDVLVSCAGTDARAFGADDGERGPFDLGADVFTDVLRVNVTGPMVVTSAFLPLLRAAANAEGADGSARPAKLVNIAPSSDRWRSPPPSDATLPTAYRRRASTCTP